MTKVITAFEAPALLDAHPTLTRYALYERLQGPPQSHGPVGLSTLLGDGAMRFAETEYGWSKPIQKTFRETSSTDIDLTARAFVTKDAGGDLLVVFVHIADYMHRMSWSKAGVPPLAFQIQANWTMWLGDHNRLAFLVLADKRLVLYEIHRDEAMIKRLEAGVAAMTQSINTKTPPPVDVSAPTIESLKEQDDTATETANLDTLVDRWRAARAAAADAKNIMVFADHADEAATAALKAVLAKGTSHEREGVRVHHNAKTGRLTEEKIDGQYF